MFLGLVIMVPLLCLTLLAAYEGLQNALKQSGFGPQLTLFGYFSLNIGLAGLVLAKLPMILEQQSGLLRPIYDSSLMLGLFGAILVRAGQSHKPSIWIGLAAIWFTVTFGIWMVSPL